LRIVGLDFGTTHSSIALYEGDGAASGDRLSKA